MSISPVDVAEVEKCLGFRLLWDGETHCVVVFTPLILRYLSANDKMAFELLCMYLKSGLINIQSARCSIVPVVQGLKDSIYTIQRSLTNLNIFDFSVLSFVNAEFTSANWLFGLQRKCCSLHISGWGSSISGTWKPKESHDNNSQVLRPTFIAVGQPDYVTNNSWEPEW